jgi:lysyl-tRNA synthetase class 1
VPAAESASPLGFAMLLNLAGVCNTEDPEVLWGFISRYAPEVGPQSHPMLAHLVGFALRYYQDFVKPHKRFRAPEPVEAKALEDLLQALEALPPEAAPEEIQNLIYEVGKAYDYANLRDWFKALYEILLGQEQGPRLGSFFALYGLDESRALIRQALTGELVS